MKRERSPLTKHFAGATAVGLVAMGSGKSYCHAAILPESAPALNQRSFSFGYFSRTYENVLGTSLNLLIRAAHPLEFQECEWRVLAETERLRRILSTYDPASEIRQVMAGAPVRSPELADLFAAYTLWSERTHGAINANMGEVIQLWKNASVVGRLPENAALQAAAARPRTYNVDALGKSFIIDRVVQVARQLAPAGLLNLGGDIRVWGGDSWLIGVANPINPAENAPPAAQFHLHEGAVATSGGYARNFTVADRVYSHVIDPRTQQPTAHLVSATMVAPDCVTANALSTAACVLGQPTGTQLARQWGAKEHLVTDAEGSVFRTKAFLPFTLTEPAVKSVDLKVPATESSPTTPTAEKTSATTSMPWPNGFQVAISISLKTPAATGNRGVKRPYVAIWIENADKKHVRTVAVWGNNERWMPQLSEWWNVSAEANLDAIKSITRATRPAGQYSVVWDGLDDQGKKMPTGDYKIFVEINREHGRHVTESVDLHCATDAQTGSIRETSESDTSKITYGPPTPVEKTAVPEKK